MKGQPLQFTAVSLLQNGRGDKNAGFRRCGLRSGLLLCAVLFLCREPAFQVYGGELTEWQAGPMLGQTELMLGQAGPMLGQTGPMLGQAGLMLGQAGQAENQKETEDSPGEISAYQEERDAAAGTSRVRPAWIRLEEVLAADGELKLFVDGSDADAGILAPEDFEVTLGNQTLPVRSATRFSDSREGVSYVYLVDVSGSIGRDRMEEMKMFLNELTGKLTDRDRVCLMTLGNDAYGDEFLTDRELIRQRIGEIQILKEDTNLYYGIAESLRILENSGAGRKVLIVVSDGEDDQAKGITKEEALQKAEEAHIPIFTAAMLGKNPRDSKIEQAKILGSFARLSPGGFHTAFGVEELTLEEGASQVAETVGSTFVLHADLAEYRPGNGQAYLLVRMRTKEGTVLKDGCQIAEGELLLTTAEVETGDKIGQKDEEKIGEKTEGKEEGSASRESKSLNTTDRQENTGGNKNLTHLFWLLGAVLLLAAAFYAAARGKKRKESGEKGEAENSVDENHDGAAHGRADHCVEYGTEAAHGDENYGGADRSGENSTEAAHENANRNSASRDNANRDETNRNGASCDNENHGGENRSGENRAEENRGSISQGGENRASGSQDIWRKSGNSGGNPQNEKAGVEAPEKTAEEKAAAKVYLTRVGLTEGTTYELAIQGRAVIGSSPARADYVIGQDPLLSEAQCAMIYRDGKLYITAVDHSRPTLVNGVPIASPYELCCDDVITIGQADYRVHW